MRYSALFGMLTAVKLNDQRRFGAAKVDNIFSFRNLTFEFPSIKLSFAQLGPKLFFCIRLLTAQLSGALNIHSMFLSPLPFRREIAFLQKIIMKR